MKVGTYKGTSIVHTKTYFFFNKLVYIKWPSIYIPEKMGMHTSNGHAFINGPQPMS